MNNGLLYWCLFFLITLVFEATAQTQVAWKRTFGTAKNEMANKVITSSDGHLMVVGFRQSEIGTLDLLVFKLSVDGDLIWEKTFGGAKTEIGYDAVELDNGNWLIVGLQQTTSNGDDIFLVKIDQSGNQLSTRTFGGPYNELPKSIFISTDKNIMIGGVQDIDPITPTAMLMKVDLDGNEIWTKNISEEKTTPLSTDDRFVMMEKGECANVVIESTDGGFLMAGSTMTNPKAALATDAWICKLGANGDKLWSKSFGAVGGDDLKGLFVDELGNIFVTGECYDKPKGEVSMWILKFSSTGELLLEEKHVGGNIFLGGASVLDEHKNVWTVGTSFNSEKRWINCDVISEVQQQKYISEGWIKVEGQNGTVLKYDNRKNDPIKLVEQVMIVQTDMNGKLLWKKLVDREKEERAMSVCNLKGVGVFVAGFTYGGGFGMKDIFVLKINHMFP